MSIEYVSSINSISSVSLSSKNTDIVIFWTKSDFKDLIQTLREFIFYDFRKQGSVNFYIDNENRYLVHIYAERIDIKDELIEHLGKLEGISDIHFDYNIASEFYESNIYQLQEKII